MADMEAQAQARIGELEASLEHARLVMTYLLEQPVIRDIKSGALCSLRDRLPWAIELAVRHHVEVHGTVVPATVTRDGWEARAKAAELRGDKLAAEKWQAVRERDAALRALPATGSRSQ